MVAPFIHGDLRNGYLYIERNYGLLIHRDSSPMSTVPPHGPHGMPSDWALKPQQGGRGKKDGVMPSTPERN